MADPRDQSSTGAKRMQPEGVHPGPSNHEFDQGPDQTAGTRRTVVDHEKQEHGGLKIGSAFFGWLTATGMAVLLTALAAAAGTAVGLASDTDVGQAADTATQQADTIGIVSAIVLLVVVAVIGAVAGAEFNVLKELNSFPRVPLDEGTMTTAGLMAVVAVLVASLVGALLGGLAGMRFHRKVDQTGLGR